MCEGKMRRISLKELLKKRIAGEQSGAFIVFTALAVWFLMMFVAFAVDFGNYYQHRTRLQNAADAAALAGIAQYADSELSDYTMAEKGKGRLVKIPTNIKEGESGKAATFSSDDYTFTKLDNVPTDVHMQGAEYVHKNYRDNLDIKDDSMWAATQESTSSTTTQAAGGSTQTTTTTSSLYYCYQVDLEDTVTTFFARIFGVEKLPVRVSAMAMLDGTKVTTVEELLQGVTERINYIIPNYYWESIANYITEIRDTSGNLVGTTAAPKKNPNDPNEKAKKYGKTNINYLVSDTPFDYTEVRYGARKEEGTGRLIIGYKDKDENGNNITDGICALPIYAEEPLEKDTDVLTQIFRFDNDGSVLYYDQEIVGLFLDRDNVVKNVGGTYYGAKDRFTEIHIGKIRGKYDENSGKYPLNPKPIYARLESEPVRIGARGVTSVCGIWIHVELTEQTFQDEGQYIKPFVFAYDGPDPNRGNGGDYDAPWIPVRKTTFKTWTNIRPAQIQQEAEPVLEKAGGSRLNIPKTMELSSQPTPGPIVVDIPSYCVFKGIIWAPRSRVKITGGGRIVGFIAARDIDDSGYFGPHTKKSQEFSMPTLAAYHVGPEHDRFNYTRYYVTDIYDVVYSGEKPIDYTLQ